MTEESFSHEDALIASYASLASDEIEETFGVEVVLTNDLRMQAGDAQGFPQINERFVCMTRQLKGAYGNAALPEIMSAAELWVQLTL